MSGEGRDRVGKFTFEGSYDVADGKCRWVKRYVGKHAVRYRVQRGQGHLGHVGAARRRADVTGGFHIWPEGMADPTQPRLAEEADVPVEARGPADARAGVGAGVSRVRFTAEQPTAVRPWAYVRRTHRRVTFAFARPDFTSSSTDHPLQPVLDPLGVVLRQLDPE